MEDGTWKTCALLHFGRFVVVRSLVGVIDVSVYGEWLSRIRRRAETNAANKRRDKEVIGTDTNGSIEQFPNYGLCWLPLTLLFTSL